MSEWRELKVQTLEDEGLIAPIQDGNHGEIHPKKADYVPSGIPFVMAKDLKDGWLDTEDCSFITKRQADSLRVGFARGNDVLLSHKGTLGRVAVVPHECELAMLTPQVTYYRVLDPSKLDRQFLAYSLRSRRFQQQLQGYSSQSTRQYVSLRTQRELSILLPSIDEQRHIAHVLGTLDDKIELNRRMNRTLEAIARAIFKSWFVDLDPVHAKAEGREPIGMNPETAALFPDSFQDSPLGKIPKGWEATSLGDVGIGISTGKRPKGGVRDLMEGVPSIGAENVLGLGRYDYGKTKYVPVEFFESMKSGIVDDRDVLLYKDGASLGRKSYFQDGFPYQECCVNEHVFLLRTGNPHRQRYLYFWLDQPSMTEEIVNLNSNSAQPGINRGGVESLPFLVPTDDVLDAYDSLVSPVFGQLFANCLANRALEDTRDALLPKLLSGENAVPGTAVGTQQEVD